MGARTPVDTVALLLTFLVAGWLAGVAVIPERLGFATRLLLSLSLGVSATVILAFPGLLAHQLGTASFLAALALLAVAAAIRSRASLAALARPQARAGWTRRLRRRWSLRRAGAVRILFMAATIGVALALIVLPQLSAANDHGFLRGTTPWYYYRLVLEMARSTGIPATIGEWGSLRAYPVEYLGTSLHTAISGILGGGPDLPFMEGYRLAILITGLAAAHALWRRWLPSWWAAVAAVLTLLLLRTSTRFVGYRPETFGFVLVLWSAWLFDSALARRSWRWGVLAGIVSAVAFHSHAEVWLVTGPLWGGILAGRVGGALLASRKVRAGPASLGRTLVTDETAVPLATGVPAPAETGMPGERPATARRRSPIVRSLIVRLAAVTILAVAGFGAVTVVAAATGTGSRIAEITEKPGGTDLRARYGDPTWAFYAEITGLDLAQNPAPDGFWDKEMQDPATVTPWWSLSMGTALGLGIVILAILVVAFGVWRGDRRLRRMAIALPLYVVGIFIGSFVLWYLYDTYVPSRAGPRRLLGFHAIALAGLIAAACWVALGTLTRALRRRSAATPDRRRALSVGGHIASVVVGVLLVGWLSIPSGALEGGKTISVDGYAAMTWIHDNLPHDKVLMVNTYTDGSVGTITGLIGWTDGRAPYLEDPAWLDQSIQRLRDARDFYLNAGAVDQDGREVAPPAGVDYVLAGQEADLAGYFTWDSPYDPQANTGEIDWDALNSYDRLGLVKSFRQNELMLYQVLPRPGGG